MKNKFLLIIILVLLFLSSLPGNEVQKVWIYFKDKDQIESKDYAQISKQYLAEKSIARRAQKSIPVKYDFSDLPINQNYIAELKKNGITIIHKSKWLNAVSALINENQYKELIKVNFIKKINSVKTFIFKNNVNEEKTTFLKPTDFDYGDSFTQNNLHGIPAFHSRQYDGTGILIALFDTGFKTSHEALQPVNVIHSWDFVENDDDVAGYPGDTHGAKVLGVIAGYSPGNLIGPAHGSDYILAKTDDYYTETHRDEDNWVAAAEWADSLGADIISTSVGYNWFDPGEGDYTYEDMDGNTTIVTIAADLAVQKGIAVFSSAGNEGNNSWHHILAPADGDSVIAIGNITSAGIISSSSSRGPSSDGQIKPDLVAMGTNVHTVATHNNSDYTSASGTSYSTPLAAGAGALVLSYDPSLTPMQLRSVLISNASRFSSPNNDYGYGIINIAPIVEGFDPDKEKLIHINPNPFNDYVNIELKYPIREKLKIYNSLGQKVKSFRSNSSFVWHGESDSNKKVASGIYFVVMEYKNSTFAKKIVLIK